jgi:uncharacterized protein YndB with AHSA1/START domain
MADILHRIGVNAPRERIYDAVSTREGLSEWWTRTVDGESRVGGELSFYFGGPDPGMTAEIDTLEEPRRVAWTCIQGPDEWMGTHITFDIDENDDETVLRFAHSDWREPSEFMSHCNTKWGLFLLGLKSGLEGGKATPFPDEVKLSSWG